MGQLGIGNTNVIGDFAGELPPTALTDVGGPFLELLMAPGSSSSCVISITRQLRCWGLNSNGQLGIGNTNNIGDNPGEMPPQSVNLPSDVALAAISARSTCAVLVSGQTYCWGFNGWGALGIGSTTELWLPTTATNLTGYTVSKIAAGSEFFCIISLAGEIACWGYNQNGEMGIGSRTDGFIGDAAGDMPPNSVSGLGAPAVQVTCGESFSCALLSNFQVKCWGKNDAGQLGIGSTSDTMAPTTPVSFSQSPVAISSASSSACAVFQSGSVTCWGSNSQGQLGIGSTASQNAPPSSTIVLGSTPVHSISGGIQNYCVLLVTGEVKCWGWNYYQLGVAGGSNIGDQPSDMPPQSSILAPSLLSITPSTFSVPGATLTLFGLSFGTVLEDLAVQTGGNSCPITVLTPLHLECQPSYSIGTYSVTVSRAGFGVSNGLPIYFPPSETRTRTRSRTLTRTRSRTRTRTRTSGLRPFIYSITPRGGFPNTLITVSGFNFGAVGRVANVSIGGLDCLPAGLNGTWDQFLYCFVPSLPIGQHAVLIARNGFVAAGSFHFTIIEPFSLASLSPPEGQQSTSVSIFPVGLFGGVSTLIVSDLEVFVSGEFANITDLGTGAVVVEMPFNSFSTHSVTVMVYGIPATNNLTFTYIQAPLLTDIQPPVVARNTILTIYGLGFGTNAAALSLATPQFVCENFAIQIDNLIVTCKVSLVQSLITAPIYLLRYTTASSNYLSVRLVDECQSLSDFFQNTSGPRWAIPWTIGTPCCAWYGVTCNSQGHVTHLQLPNNQLGGGGISGLDDLYQLAVLDLSSNNLTGSLGTLCGNPDLELINLSNNAFTGLIPDCTFRALHTLDLSLNSLSSRIPNSFASLPALENLLLFENSLSGTLPAGFSRLVVLDVFGNQLSGTVPPEIGTTGPLQTLNIGTNFFTGALPLEYCFLQNSSLGCNFFSTACGFLISLDVDADCLTKGAAPLYLKNTCERFGLYLDIYKTACVSNCSPFSPQPTGSRTTQCGSNVTCTEGCSLCNGPGLVINPLNCTLCDSRLNYTLSLDGASCTPSCGPHQVVSTSSDTAKCQCDYRSGWFPNAAKSACLKCGSSNQYIGSDNTCKACHPDCASCTGASPGDCLTCPFGVEFYSAGGGGCTGSCASCLESFVRRPGGVECVCPPGTSLQSGACIPCPANTYAPGYGIDNICLPCGSFRTSGVNSTSPSECVCATTFIEVGGSCVCQAGSFYDPTLGNCVACPADTYSVAPSVSTECLRCSDLGLYRTTNRQPGQNSSLACGCSNGMVLSAAGNCTCSPGSFLEIVGGIAQCRDCPADTYADGWSQPACTPCLAVGRLRTTRNEIRSNTSQACVCPVTFQEDPVTLECLCEPGYRFDSDAKTCFSCGPNTFSSNRSISSFCESCDSISFHRTTNGRSGSTSPSECVCSNGYFPSGASCVGCDKLGGVADCVGGSADSGLSVVAQAGLDVAVGYWLTTNPRFMKASDTDQFWFKIYKCPVRDGCLGGPAEEACAQGYEGPVCGICSEGFGRLGEQCAKCPSQSASAFLVFLAILLVIVACVAIVYFSGDDSQKKAQGQFDQKSGFDAVDMQMRIKIAITHLQIIGFTANFASQWPEVLIRVFAIPTSAATISSASDNIATDCATHPTLYTRGAIVMILPLILACGVVLGYAALGAVRGSFSETWSKTQQGTLVLLYVAHPGIVQSLLKLMVCIEIGNESYAKSDMTVSCKDPAFGVLRIFAILHLVLYGFGGLLLLFWVMRRNPHAFTYLTEGYKPERFYWDLVVTVRKILFVIVSLFASAPLQLFFGTWILLLSWIAHHFAEPYLSNMLAKMESASLWVLLITVTTGMLFYTSALGSAGDGVSVFLILLNFGGVTVFLVLAIRKFFGLRPSAQAESLSTF
eukprot:TRINITY_DN532_c0_g3_i1.p1 TRINITY_DN532_c0_g3~~TRINITY_DN532_c0_g3_i1.p1  ORF type:complete len:2148 (+),score=347.78 TRINITY_DN532_c0_g3_i1:766-6444(+)